MLKLLGRKFCSRRQKAPLEVGGPESGAGLARRSGSPDVDPPGPGQLHAAEHDSAGIEAGAHNRAVPLGRLRIEFNGRVAQVVKKRRRLPRTVPDQEPVRTDVEMLGFLGKFRPDLLADDIDPGPLVKVGPTPVALSASTTAQLARL